MAIRIVCPSCGKVLRAHESLEGKRVRCRECKDIFVAAPDSPIDADDDVEILAPVRENSGQDGTAIASLVLGILSLVGWCLPLIGLPMTIVGLVLGFKSLGSQNRGMAIAGIVLNILGLLLSVVNAAFGAYLGVTGQHPLFKK
jgi:biopolymer transport protein ExbB/TolQ